MAGQHPFLQRRGDKWFFRIGVPAELRLQVGAREICRALGTGERRVAVPLALQLGAAATTLFHHLRHPMTNPPDPKMLSILRLAKSEARRAVEREEADLRLADEQVHARERMGALRREQDARMAALAQEHEHALKLQAAMVERDTLKAALQALQTLPAAQVQGGPAVAASNAPAAPGAPLHALIDEFLGIYASGKKSAMAKKIQPAMALLRELHVSKRHTDLKQRDIEEFFDVVSGLPPRWSAKCKAQKLSARELAALDHEELLSSKSWAENYREPVRLFLKWARKNRHDEGFPPNLNADTFEFQGEDDSGRWKQRALRPEELERLFHGPELQACKTDPARAHQWWLVALAFFTGGRANELAQANPQVDIQHDPASGIDYLVISDKTEADPRIRKSVKSGEARVVPLHPELIAGGFLDYVEKMRADGSRLLFPAWSPINKRASIQAERWFRDLLRDTGLRDETPGACVLGLHAFRHGILTLAANSAPPIDAGPITGHADQTKGAPQRGYEVQGLPMKLRTLKAIQFNFSP